MCSYPGVRAKRAGRGMGKCLKSQCGKTRDRPSVDRVRRHFSRLYVPDYVAVLVQARFRIWTQNNFSELSQRLYHSTS